MKGQRGAKRQWGLGHGAPGEVTVTAFDFCLLVLLTVGRTHVGLSAHLRVCSAFCFFFPVFVIAAAVWGWGSCLPLRLNQCRPNAFPLMQLMISLSSFNKKISKALSQLFQL